MAINTGLATKTIKQEGPTSLEIIAGQQPITQDWASANTTKRASGNNTSTICTVHLVLVYFALVPIVLSALAQYWLLPPLIFEAFGPPCFRGQ